MSARPNPHVHAVPALVPDLLAAGLDVAELELAPGVWCSQCPACVARDWPTAGERHLRLVQVDAGEPGDVTCANGCTYLEIVDALAQLVRDRMAATAGDLAAMTAVGVRR